MQPSPHRWPCSRSDTPGARLEDAASSCCQLRGGGWGGGGWGWWWWGGVGGRGGGGGGGTGQGEQRRGGAAGGAVPMQVRSAIWRAKCPRAAAFAGQHAQCSPAATAAHPPPPHAPPAPEALLRVRRLEGLQRHRQPQLLTLVLLWTAGTARGRLSAGGPAGWGCWPASRRAASSAASCGLSHTAPVPSRTLNQLPTKHVQNVI